MWNDETVVKKACKRVELASKVHCVSLLVSLLGALILEVMLQCNSVHVPGIYSTWYKVERGFNTTYLCMLKAGKCVCIILSFKCV